MVERIVRINQRTHPEIFKALQNYEVISATEDFINVAESVIDQAIVEHGLNSEILSGPTCPVCGRVIPEGLYPDWRGSICLSKWYTCSGCIDLADSTFYELLSLDQKTKNDYMIKLLQG